MVFRLHQHEQVLHQLLQGLFQMDQAIPQLLKEVSAMHIKMQDHQQVAGT